ncbi:vitellogenin-1-like [Stomoxys calcitrans]|uniref:vitellogenin-1-like n=1 Tax=Stomoxys calcitrans TaxID=35570 RepID=UPI0027E35475|nr:vitellogenin-1-like [Stomoxys calcitrans]
MNPLGVLCLVACLAGAVLASPTQYHSNSNSYKSYNSNSLKPSQWLKASELEHTPSMDEVSFEQLEKMPLEQGAELMRKYYHLTQAGRGVAPEYVPTPSQIPVHIYSNGRKETTDLSRYVQTAKNMPKFGDDEVTIFITGLPQSLESVKEANKDFIEAYLERCSQQPHAYAQWNAGEERRNWEDQKQQGRSLIVIDLGNTITDVKRYASLDVERCGEMFGKTFVELSEECDVPAEIIHVVGQGVGANVAGVAGQKYYDETSEKFHRITALDPAVQMAKDSHILTGLARSDAEFVDAIHTSALGLGTTRRVGDLDFFPEGPSAGSRNADNVVEASMLATHYYAESVRPGNEHNFPAREANSMAEYKNKESYGKRAYMGIAADRDLSGDFMLEVNPQSPYGKRTPAHNIKAYHSNTKSYQIGQNQQKHLYAPLALY